jgi:prevent-host-death family protein
MFVSGHERLSMQTKGSSKARAEFCAIVREAGRGNPTTITRKGRPAAMVISIEDAYRLYPEQVRKLVDQLPKISGE